MNFSFTKEQEMIRREMQNFCEKELTPEYVRWMDENCDFMPDDLWKKLADIGFFGCTIPEEYGGAGYDSIEQTIMLEELSTASAAVSLNTMILGPILVRDLGTPQQKDFYLPRMARGEVKMAFALTEPAGGTDVLGAMQLTAVEKSDHWLLNGQKVFTTSAHVADSIATIAITNPDVKRTQGLSILIVPRPTEGLETRLIPKLGCHAAGTNEVFYDNVRVPKENLLGTLNNGWYELLGTLNPERIITAVVSLGIAKAAYREAVDYAKKREAFQGPIARFQAIQHALADIAIEIENARNLIYKCAWLKDEGKPFEKEVCMAKIVAGKASEMAAITGMEIMGGWGYTMEYDMQRHFRDYKQMIFAPITDEMARNMIMRFSGFPRSW